MANSDNTVMATNPVAAGTLVNAAAAGGCRNASANKCAGPGNIKKVTKPPTARKATNFMIDSLAIASISPS